ncbi:glyoxylate reductase [Fusarium austroafricanum]|uniref:Glyoxylate reductase n=1 Tax=Fusarium austroafricanum TaxID=2364996 RepID=A0A8H4NSH4_9HYPO|nr:glyoxylate reductase [Fusarium austroafricanum]
MRPNTSLTVPVPVPVPVPVTAEARLTPGNSPCGSPTKRAKSTADSDIDKWAYWEYPPHFWDNLSKVSLSPRALKEVDRRARNSRSQLPASTAGEVSSNIARFARQGGPDLSDLRGYPYPATMNSRESPQSKGNELAIPETEPTPTSTTTKQQKSKPCSGNFRQHLTDHKVEPLQFSEKPRNTDEILSTLAQRRLSLSLSNFSDGSFEGFYQTSIRVMNEDDVMAKVLPTIFGSSVAGDLDARNILFGNLEPLTDGSLVSAKPDIYHGSSPGSLSLTIRNEIGHHIVPSTKDDRPIVPNFFVEVKGPRGNELVVERQACYDGSIGARAMHSLQTYGQESPQYDGQARCFSATFFAGQLQMFAHHATAPVDGDGDRPTYHMTYLGGYCMKNSRATFIEGASAFRNLRDLAKQQRDVLIQAANDTIGGRSSPPIPDANQNDEKSADGVADNEESPHLKTFDEPFREGDDSVNSTKRKRQPPSPDSDVATESPPSKIRRC